MMTDFQISFTDRLSSKYCSKAIITYPATPQTLRYTTLWMFVNWLLTTTKWSIHTMLSWSCKWRC